MLSQPESIGFYIFRGMRRSHPGTVQILIEPVEVVEVFVGAKSELAVAMTGRATKWPLSRFEGTWELLRLEGQP